MGFIIWAMQDTLTNDTVEVATRWTKRARQLDENGSYREVVDERVKYP